MPDENDSVPDQPDPQAQAPDSQPTAADYKPGDIVNGYQLSDDGQQWLPVGSSSSPPQPAPAQVPAKKSIWKRPGCLIPLIIVVVLLLMCGVVGLFFRDSIPQEYSGQDLRNTQLTNDDLPGNFSGANLSGMNLFGLDFSKARGA